MAKVSIIVPVYKAEAFLRRCVDSILGQTYQDFEVILINDGSPDASGRICDAYAEKDSRVHVIHQKNQGVSAARNAGMDWIFANSESHWVAFVDSDDWIHKDYLKFLMQAVLETGANMAVCDCIWTDHVLADTDLEPGEVDLLDAEQAFVRYYPRFLPPWEKLIQKDILRDIRFPLGMRYEDAAVSHLMVFASEKIAVCDEKLYYYYSNQESFTRTAWTDARMDCITVHENRLAYLREKGYQKAYARELEEYVERLTSTLHSLTDLLGKSEKYQVFFDELRAKLRSAIKEGRELKAFGFDRERLMSYVYACPGTILWKSARALQRQWRKFRWGE